MEYAYVICPKCWNRLIEVEKIEDLNLYEQKKCPDCGTRFGLAIMGERKIDDSTYKIILTSKGEWEFDDTRARKELEKFHIDSDAVTRAISAGEQGSVIYEGDTFHTYLCKCALSEYGVWITFDVVPKLPYKIFRPDYHFCPECGTEVIDRQEPYDSIKGWFLDGFFCKNCNKWTLGPAAIPDTTVYKLVFPYGKLKSMKDSSIKRGIMNCLQRLPDKKIQGDQILVHTDSERILELVPYLRLINFAYEISPPFPHKIDQ
ncbi:MAG: hypothetical protein K2M91_03255 [Lachnospiraceae bacterium]|nr:hypothetical protein [Lachnospiraceae bacterium]